MLYRLVEIEKGAIWCTFESRRSCVGKGVRVFIMTWVVCRHIGGSPCRRSMKYKSTRQETGKFGSGDEGVVGRLVSLFSDFFQNIAVIHRGVGGRESMAFDGEICTGGSLFCNISVVVDLFASSREMTPVVVVFAHVWRRTKSMLYVASGLLNNQSVIIYYYCQDILYLHRLSCA